MFKPPLQRKVEDQKIIIKLIQSQVKIHTGDLRVTYQNPTSKIVETAVEHMKTICNVSRKMPIPRYGTALPFFPLLPNTFFPLLFTKYHEKLFSSHRTRHPVDSFVWIYQLCYLPFNNFIRLLLMFASKNLGFPKTDWLPIKKKIQVLIKPLKITFLILVPSSFFS